jgi:NADH-quinone oxidoreductase subunit E
MLRRLHKEQPESFAFTPDNAAWADAQITKYPEGRQASAIIPLLWRAQEQEGWLTRPAIEGVADMLGMDYIRALEVASFYFMFQLQPVGSVAHIQICGTTSCMICGAEDLVAVCKEKIAPKAHQISADGKFSWEEVECLGACANAPMAQIGKDYYEDLTATRMGELIDEMAAGKVPVPGSQNGRYAAEPLKGLTSLTEYDSGKTQYNASVQLATDIGDTIKRIDGTEVPLIAPWGQGAPTSGGKAKPAPKAKPAAKAKSAAKATAAVAKARPKPSKPAAKPATQAARKPVAKDGKPEMLKKARAGGADDLKMIKGVGPKLEALLNKLGVYHFDQVAGWRKAEVSWVDEHLEGFKGRVSRDNWVSQAKTLAKGGTTEFSGRVKKGGVY